MAESYLLLPAIWTSYTEALILPVVPKDNVAGNQENLLAKQRSADQLEHNSRTSEEIEDQVAEKDQASASSECILPSWRFQVFKTTTNKAPTRIIVGRRTVTEILGTLPFLLSGGGGTENGQRANADNAQRGDRRRHPRLKENTNALVHSLKREAQRATSYHDLVLQEVAAGPRGRTNQGNQAHVRFNVAFGLFHWFPHGSQAVGLKQLDYELVKARSTAIWNTMEVHLVKRAFLVFSPLPSFSQPQLACDVPCPSNSWSTEVHTNREVKQEGRRLYRLITWVENGVVKVATVVLQKETCVPGDVQDSSILNPVEVDRPNDKLLLMLGNDPDLKGNREPDMVKGKTCAPGLIQNETTGKAGELPLLQVGNNISDLGGVQHSSSSRASGRGQSADLEPQASGFSAQPSEQPRC
ncbi:hypothetical protein EDB92DRAFT_1817552 [Lactarius akahatsu]|uniref:Uncharacterized protein n=1 Tax=Lactarius akahatsu TaxID=416441 RepID=A0AAD4LH39_9AGAM|nr:hypothetical protein EDB92DRAFT_1817552 [Lactarius akahatsu]